MKLFLAFLLLGAPVFLTSCAGMRAPTFVVLQHVHVNLNVPPTHRVPGRRR